MSEIVAHIAWILGLAASLIAAAILTWNGVSLWTLVFRSLLSGAVVFLFARVGGHLAGQSILRGLAEAQLKRQARAKQDDGSESAGTRAA